MLCLNLSIALDQVLHQFCGATPTPTSVEQTVGRGSGSEVRIERFFTLRDLQVISEVSPRVHCALTDP